MPSPPFDFELSKVAFLAKPARSGHPIFILRLSGSALVLRG